MYKLCTQHGYLEGEFVGGITAQMLRINPMRPNLENNLSIAKASALYNNLGVVTFANVEVTA